MSNLKLVWLKLDLYFFKIHVGVSLHLHSVPHDIHAKDYCTPSFY